MSHEKLIEMLLQPSSEKVVFLVLDGLGGIPKNGKTELEAANTPNLDLLAKESDAGLMIPVLPGITPGSGPGHLALFGYDPIKFQIGRGILSALGVKFPIQAGDLAARVNFATIDSDGNVVDRRAGRIPDEVNRAMCEKIREIRIPGVEFFIETEKEHRAALIFRGRKFSDRISETDPQKTGVPPIKIKPLDDDPVSKDTADMLNDFLEKVREILKNEHPANMILLRGFALHTKIPSFKERYGMRACAIAGYPMYRGLASLVGMEIIDVESGIKPQFEKLKEVWGKYDFYFIHIKYTDSSGEDGDFERKVSIIEDVDRNIPEILALKPEVFVVTADHSTPSLYRAHSWHPVPVIIHSRWSRKSGISGFGETELAKGSLGIMNSCDLITLILSHSGRLAKFGA